MDANAAKQVEKVQTVYPIENAYEVRAKKQIERVEREMRGEEAALTPEERQRKKRRSHDAPSVQRHNGAAPERRLTGMGTHGRRPLPNRGAEGCHQVRGRPSSRLTWRGCRRRRHSYTSTCAIPTSGFTLTKRRTTRRTPCLRRNLNTYYDEFVMRYGNLNAKHNAKLILMDASGRNMLSLERGENGQFVKADIFDRPVSFSQETLVEVESPEEALSASLNLYGGVNPALHGITLRPAAGGDARCPERQSVLQPQLADGYEIADRFIAGNVVQKVADVEEWIRGHEGHGMIPQAQESLEALKNAVPEQIPFEDLDFNFGERWIPTGVYAAYMSRLFDTEVRITYSESLDEYSVKCAYKTMKITDEFLVKGYYRNYDGMNLLKHALHNTCPDMMKSIGKDENGNDIKVRDSEGIQLANAKIDEIRNGFTEWLEEQSPEFKKRLTDMYNDKFNCFVRPKYDGSHQKFPDLDLKGLGIKDLYTSQKDCVWMLKQNRGGIVDNEVGTGKTTDHVRCGARDEASGTGTQADDYRAEGQRARDCRDLPQGLSQRPHPLRLGEGLCRRPTACVSSMTSATTTGIASSCRTTSSGKSRSRRSCSSASCRRSWTRWRKTSKCCAPKARTCHEPCCVDWRKGKSTFRRNSKRWNTP